MLPSCFLIHAGLCIILLFTPRDGKWDHRERRETNLTANEHHRVVSNECQCLTHSKRKSLWMCTISDALDLLADFAINVHTHKHTHKIKNILKSIDYICKDDMLQMRVSPPYHQ